MRIYLDNNATTPMDPRVVDALASAARDLGGNASSVHLEGRTARRVLEESREKVAALLDAELKDTVFTSGGTESNNAVLRGVFLRESECFHAVTTSIEHPSIDVVMRDLADKGCNVTFVRPGTDGAVRAEEIIGAIRPETKLVAVMLANNETGVLQPVRQIAAACRERGVWIHSDVVQAVGKIPVSVDDLGVDSLSISGHKFHGPKGIGVLWIRPGLALEPILLGGSQERRRRAGTEPVFLAAGLGVAASIARDAVKDVAPLANRRDRMEARILAEIDGTRVNGKDAPRLPNTTNLTVEGCEGESLVIGLDLEGIAVSGGSACHSGRVEASGVLLEMGISEKAARSAIRISLGRETTDAEVDRFVETLKSVVGTMRSAGAEVAG